MSKPSSNLQRHLPPPLPLRHPLYLPSLPLHFPPSTFPTRKNAVSKVHEAEQGEDKDVHYKDYNGCGDGGFGVGIGGGRCGLGGWWVAVEEWHFVGFRLLRVVLWLL